MNKPVFGGIIETHVREPKNLKFVDKLLPGWSLADNYSFSVLGKIWVVWHPSVKVNIIGKSLQMVSCEVLLPETTTWIIVSIIYASNDDSDRRELWKEMVELSVDPRVVTKPWLVLGDFNQTLNPVEHSVVAKQSLDRKMMDFRATLEEAALADLTYKGSTFTWWNKSGTRPVAKKLDRVLSNDKWSALFPSSYAMFGEPDFSDHASCGVTLDLGTLKQKRPFKFFNFLLQNEKIWSLIAEHWFSGSFSGSAMYRVSKKLKSLKGPIRKFSKENYSDLEKRTAEAHDLLLLCQSRMLDSPSLFNANQELEAQRKWGILSSAEEAFLCQKSRVTWLREGDCNSAYFHRMAASRKVINHIHYLYDANGVRVESDQGIRKICADYFENLLGGVVDQQMFIQEDIDLLLPYKCSTEQSTKLESNFSSEEIKDAFFSLPRNKTSGPDGYSAEFFTAFWSLLGPEVSEAVSEFFNSGKILRQWNASSLVLIPKITNASSTSDFRPISCLNTVYKVISKLLANRLQGLLSEVISPSQSAFMPGRLLAENVLLATEIVHGYNWRNIEPRAMLKVDLRKAFDSVRWDFILATLKAIGIPQRFVNWIFQCISTASFTVSVNGNSGGFFKSTKGLRQGDPLSPYLFVLSMEVFSRLLQSRFEAGYIRYHPKTTELNISHLMFADDVMVFFDGGSSSLHGITEALEDFASWSGLQMNRNKTELFHAGVNQSESTALAAYGFPIGALPIRYLGLPLMYRKLRIGEYEPLMEKLRGRFRSWAVKTLSFAGRSQLIASVISGTVNFWISTFILPQACIKKIESLCARFLWSGAIDSSRGAKVAWSTVCLPKNEGGLGLRRYSEWNKTLCLRFIWLLFSGKDTLWSLWHKHHYVKDASFWSIKESSNSSYAWRSILKLRPLAERFLKAKLGNGESTSFWFDVWTPMGPLIRVFGEDGPMNFCIPASAKVADACSNDGWMLPSPRSDMAVDLHAHLTTIKVPSASQRPDTYSWTVENVDCKGFSSAKTWDAMRRRAEKTSWRACVWFKGYIPKHAFNMWVANLNRLPTRARLASWGIINYADCCLCGREDETRDHLLLKCPFSQTIWNIILQKLDFSHRSFMSWSELLSWTKLGSLEAPSLLRKIVVHAAIYHIWKQRNNVLHNGHFLQPGTIFKTIYREVINIITARRRRRHFGDLMCLWL